MRIRPFRPLIFPAILLVFFTLLAVTFSVFKQFDSTVAVFVQSVPRSWEGAIMIITKIGDAPTLVVVALAVSLFELLRRNRIRALTMSATLLSLPAFFLVKESVRRARPVSDFIYLHDLHGYSFPSGHSTGTMAVFGMIALLAYSHMKGVARFAVVGFSAVIILLVGFSRVYLGAHFPTDVIAGWLLGIVIISLLRTLSLYLAKHSSKPNTVAIEDTTENPEALQD